MTKQKGEQEKSRADPKAGERRRLKSLAFSHGLLSRGPPSSSSPSLRPSATVLKHAGKDVVKKGHRKNRFLFSFPGLFAPHASGGRIGELTDLASGNPILYLDFLKGRMKLFGTIMYPKNRYLTLRFARKNVLCEDSFDSLVVFSDAWWIGTKEENPQEAKLDFPKELIQEKYGDRDFQGGAGGTAGERASGDKISKEFVEPLSPDAEQQGVVSEDSNLDSGNHNTDKMQMTPVRQSARTLGKTLNYAEPSSDVESMDESTSSDADESDTSQQKVGGNTGNTVASISDLSKKKNHPSNAKSSNPKIQSSEEAKLSGSTRNAEESSSKNKSVLVQTTLSTLFEKVAKKSKQNSDEHLLQKGADSNQQGGNKKPSTRTKKMLTKQGTGRKKSGTKKQPKESKVEEDDVEDILSDSEDMDESDEDWTA